MDKYNSPPVSDEQKKIFELLTDGYQKGLAALSGKFMGQDVSYIVQVTRDGDGMLRDSFTLTPLAIIVDEAFFKRFGNEMFDAEGVAAVAKDIE